TNYRTVDTIAGVEKLVASARASGHIAIDTEIVLDAGAPDVVDPLRARLVGISVAVAPGEAYYLPFSHRERQPDQGSLGLMDDTGTEPPKRRAAKTSSPTSIAARSLAERQPVIKNLPSVDTPEMQPLRALLQDPAVKKTGHNVKFDQLALRV